jgi:hypothetical protein
MRREKKRNLRRLAAEKEQREAKIRKCEKRFCLEDCGANPRKGMRG